MGPDLLCAAIADHIRFVFGMLRNIKHEEHRASLGTKLDRKYNKADCSGAGGLQCFCYFVDSDHSVIVSGHPVHSRDGCSIHRLD